MDQHGSPAARQLEQGTRVRPPRWPAKHEIDGFGLLVQGDRDFTRAQTLAHVAHQQVDDRGSSERPRDLLAESGQSPNEVQIAGGRGLIELNRGFR